MLAGAADDLWPGSVAIESDAGGGISLVLVAGGSCDRGSAALGALAFSSVMMRLLSWGTTAWWGEQEQRRGRRCDNCYRHHWTRLSQRDSPYLSLPRLLPAYLSTYSYLQKVKVAVTGFPALGLIMYDAIKAITDNIARSLCTCHALIIVDKRNDY